MAIVFSHIHTYILIPLLYVQILFILSLFEHVKSHARISFSPFCARPTDIMKNLLLFISILVSERPCPMDALQPFLYIPGKIFNHFYLNTLFLSINLLYYYATLTHSLTHLYSSHSNKTCF